MNTEAEMPFLQHLAELRVRLLLTLAGISVASFVCYYWASEIFAELTSPLKHTFGELSIIGTGPADAFMVKLTVVILAGCIVSSPFTFLQLWKFISPGLLEKERRFAIPFVLFTTVFFLAGVAFCFYVALPYAFSFFSEEFVSIGVVPQIRITEYLSFVTKLMLVFGFVFELPVGSYFLARLGVINHRWLIQQFRYALVIIFIAAGILTPPDVASQLMLAAPLLVLYGICILVTYFVASDKPAAVEKTRELSAPIE